MGSEGPGKYDKVRLIPWDAADARQYQRMYDQRIACGWRHEEVPEWKDKVLAGTKFLYWVVLSDGLPGREEILAEHVEQYEKEREELVDTATAVCQTPRTPTGAKFLPIGHIALEFLPKDSAEMSLPESSLWIKSLYISWRLHERGLGRSAMAQTEQLASAPPLNASVLVLDTIEGNFQLENLAGFFSQQGLGRPREMRANQHWYERQGYQVFKRVQDGYDWERPDGEKMSLPIVYMKKDIV